MRLLALAALAAAVTALPAGALATGPACVARLTPAAADASCETNMLGDTRNTSGGWVRTVTIEVVTGSATATLFCTDGYRTWSGSRTVAGPGAGYLQTWDDESCTVTLVALADGTVATATSTASYSIHLER